MLLHFPLALFYRNRALSIDGLADTRRLVRPGKRVLLFPVRIKLGMVTVLFIAQNKREVGYLNLGKMKLGKNGRSLV